MGKLITNPQIKKALYNAEKSECVDLIAEFEKIVDLWHNKRTGEIRCQPKSVIAQSGD